MTMKARRSLIASFADAIRGLRIVIATQRNFRIHVAAAALVLLGAWYLDVSTLQLGLLVLTIALVVITEAVNTALERAVDLVTQEYHPTARAAKDIAAGAVLLAVLVAIMVGLIILGPRLWHLLSQLVNS